MCRQKILSIIALGFLLLSGQVFAGPEQRTVFNVLVINAPNPESPFTQLFNKGFQRQLANSDLNIEVFNEYLDIGRLKNIDVDSISTFLQKNTSIPI